ncbi:EEV maturation protein [Squirrelpox virus]|uniref:A5L n=1 Tax=Squirrelpox virus TaxID=240426 RepID=Q1HTT9_9POXV|nr:EEV maturation protein [Squirrelpox virus]ABD51447.1 A5L [Squirrelpox virus]CCD83196.1 EEV maturation protein [Squirrelpox virus]
MLGFLARVCSDGEWVLDDTDSVTPVLAEAKSSTVAALTPEGRGVLATVHNMAAVRSTIDVRRLTVAKVCGLRPEAPPVLPHPRLFMNSSETDCYFSPRTCQTPPLVQILSKCAETNSALMRAICLHWPGNDKMTTVAAINTWMCRHGLARNRLLRMPAARRLGLGNTGARTVIDDMTVCDIGYHAILVKDPVRYSRPEIDIYLHDVEAMADESMWSRLRPDVPRSCVYAVVVHAMLRGNAPVPFMISTYPPGNVFVDVNDPAALISAFLEWLRGAMVGDVRNATLVGYMNGLLDLPLLREFLPPASGWDLCGATTLLSHDGLRADFVDLSRYALGQPHLRKHCEYWTGAGRDFPPDLAAESHVKSRIPTLMGAGREVAQCLFEAAVAQQVTLTRIMPFCAFSSFGCAEDMFLANAAMLGAGPAGYYVPAHASVAAFVAEAVRPESVQSFTCKNRVPLRCLQLRSVARVAMDGLYPVGRPYHTLECDSSKPYIALCEVKRKSSVRIPAIFAPEDPEASSFEAVLTSVDIALAAYLGGYKIRILSALQWDFSAQILRTGVMKIADEAARAETDQTSRFMMWMATTSKLLRGSEAGACAFEALVVAAFAASHCRFHLHKIVCDIDSHFVGDVVERHSFCKVWLREPAGAIADCLSKQLEAEE